MGDTIVPRSRANELTAVVNRNRFDDPPGDLTDPADLDRWRRFREAYHRASVLDGPEDFPLQVDFELTSRCNLRCAFCVHGHEKVPPRELTFDRFARVIDEGQGYGLASIKMNYINEPLLSRDLFRAVRYAKDRGVLNVYFATNGVLLTERFREEVVDARVSKVMVSLDAATPETFRAMRRSTQFDLIVRNIRALLDLRARRGVKWPLVRVNFLKTELNVHEAERFLDEWSGVADVVGYQDQVGLPGVDEGVLPSHAAEFRCAFPFKLLVVDSAGHVLPCCTFSGREMPLGHVDDVTLSEAWRSRRATELRALHLRGGWESNPVCRHCVKGS